MTKLFTLFVGLLAFIATESRATGLVRKIYNCSGGTGEYFASITVNHISTSPPGGPVHQYLMAGASTSWLGGTHQSGQLVVNRVVDVDGTESYFNKQADFLVTVHEKQATSEGELSKLRVLASGHFVDPQTGMQGSFSNRWLSCK